MALLERMRVPTSATWNTWTFRQDKSADDLVDYKNKSFHNLLINHSATTTSQTHTRGATYRRQQSVLEY